MSEDLGSLITQEQYTNLSACISRYRDWIDEAYEADTRDESIRLWRKIFGDEFASSVVLVEGRNVSAKARMAIAALAKIENLGSDLVSLVRRYGRVALPPGFDLLPYKHEPEWDYSSSLVPSRVVATLHRTEQAPALEIVESLSIVPKNHGLWFDVRDARGQSFSINEFRVQWRVTNTDEEAFVASCMRGEFNPPKIGNKRWESLVYRGIHTVEAFVIKRNDNLIISVSEPFYVSIE